MSAGRAAKPKPVREPRYGVTSRTRFVQKGFMNEWLNEGPSHTRAVGFTDPRRPSWEWPDEDKTIVRR